jgi:hypothetical protein
MKIAAVTGDGISIVSHLGQSTEVFRHTYGELKHQPNRVHRYWV